MNKEMENFIKKYNISNKVDKVTVEKLKRFDDYVIPIHKLVFIAEEAAKRLDICIRLNKDIISPRHMVWGEVFDKFVADVINEYCNNFTFTRCSDHNVERDVHCVENDSFDIEVKTALKSLSGGYNGFYNHTTNDPENSTKYKSEDEKNYYLLAQLDRDCDTCVTKVVNIWFGRLSEADWKKNKSNSTLSAENRDKFCIKIK